MTAMTDEMTRIAQDGQQATTAALTAWVEVGERYAKNFDPQHPLPAAADAQAVVDIGYDLAAKLLAGQRAVATTIVTTGQESAAAMVERARAFVPAPTA